LNPLFKKLASQTAVYGLSNIIGRFLNYLLVPIYTRVFLPAEYGVVNEMYAYASFLGVVFTYGMETSFFRYMTTEDNKKQVNDTALLSVICSTLLLSGLFIFFAGPIAGSIRFSAHPEYVVWFALILGFDAITAIPFAKLRVKNLPGHYAFYKLFNIGINIILNLYFLLLCPWLKAHGAGSILTLGYNPSFGVGYVFVANLLSSGLTFLLMTPFFVRRRYSFNMALWKHMFRYAFPLLFVGLAGMVNETMDRILLKYFLPAGTDVEFQIGIYGACYKLSLLMTLFVQAFRMAGEPFFFGESNRPNAKEIYSLVMNYFLIACFFIFLVVMLGMDIFKHFIGSRYHEGLDIVPILLLANLCLGVYYNLTIWYKLTGKTTMGAYISLMGAGITLLLNIWWIPLIGFRGSAWATLICYASMMLVSYLSGQKYFYVPYNLRKAGLYGFVTLALWLLSLLIHQAFAEGTVAVTMTANLLLLLAFLIFVYFVEVRKKLGKYTGRR